MSVDAGADGGLVFSSPEGPVDGAGGAAEQALDLVSDQPDQASGGGVQVEGQGRLEGRDGEDGQEVQVRTWWSVAVSSLVPRAVFDAPTGSGHGGKASAGPGTSTPTRYLDQLVDEVLTKIKSAGKLLDRYGRPLGLNSTRTPTQGPQGSLVTGHRYGELSWLSRAK